MTKDGDNCGNGHFSISCLFRGCCYRMVAGIFPGALNRFRHLRFSCLIWLINKALSTSRMELFYFSLSAAAVCCTHGIKTDKFDTLRSCLDCQQAILLLRGRIYTFYIFLTRFSRCAIANQSLERLSESAKRDFRLCTTESPRRRRRLHRKKLNS